MPSKLNARGAGKGRDKFGFCSELDALRVEPNTFPGRPGTCSTRSAQPVEWPIMAPISIEGGLPLAESALALWPPGAGDPNELLGSDAFEHLDRDYRVVFERRIG